MNKEQNVLNFYATCNRLKYLVRTGWKYWKLNKDRLESVAEHVYGTQMLALAMYKEYEYDIDITKVITMLAIHELEETVIGDLVFYEISAEEKIRIGHEAIEKILSGLNNSKDIHDLIIEFDAKETKEAKFAYYCDKLECDIQAKIYDEMGCINISDPNIQNLAVIPEAKIGFQNGASWSEMWITNDQKRIGFDKHFNEVAEHAKNNDISVNTDNLQ